MSFFKFSIAVFLQIKMSSNFKLIRYARASSNYSDFLKRHLYLRNRLLDLQSFSQKFVSIVLTFSLKIILRQFLSPFYKDYITTNFNLTTKITLTIKILPQVYSIQHFVIKFVSDLRQVNGFLLVLQFSPPIKLTDILLKGTLNTIYHLPQQPSFISITQQNLFLNKIIL